jgi:hypothetical protein
MRMELAIDVLRIVGRPIVVAAGFQAGVHLPGRPPRPTICADTRDAKSMRHQAGSLRGGCLLPRGAKMRQWAD